MASERRSAWTRVPTITRESSSTELDFENIADILAALKKSPNIYTSLCSWMKKSSGEWKRQFLDEGGLDVILQGLLAVNSSKVAFSEAIFQLQIVQCIKVILNNEVGMVHLIERNRDLLPGLTLCKFIVLLLFSPGVIGKGVP